MDNRFPREFYYPKDARAVRDKLSSAIAYLYEDVRGRDRIPIRFYRVAAIGAINGFFHGRSPALSKRYAVGLP